MRIPDSKIAEITAAANIVEVISEYVELKKAGKDYRGLCPFHGEKDPSFYVSPQKQIFHCFGCAVGGSVFRFLMKIENISFIESVQSLAGRYGIALNIDQRAVRHGKDEKDKIKEALEIAHRFFRERLASASVAQNYLTSRGITGEQSDEIGFGYAPPSWESMTNFLQRSPVESKHAVAAGLLRSRQSGGHYDYFRSRLMIPIHDLSGELTAFGGRIIGDGEPKYLNSPDSVVFRKKSVLYGLHAAREAIRREGFIVLTEGYFDQISLRIRGLANAAAPLGTAVTREQVRLMARFTDRIVTVFDSDEAGLRAVKRSIPLFLSEGIEPRTIVLTEFKDPDEAVNSIGIDGFRKMLDDAVPVTDFLLDSLESQYDLTEINGRNAALEECIPVLQEIADSVERDYLIERFSARIRVKEDRIRRALAARKKTTTNRDRTLQPVTPRLFDFPADERNVVRGMLLREGFIDRVLESGVAKDLHDPLLRDLAQRIIQSRNDAGEFDAIAFSNSLEDEQTASLVAGWMSPRREEDDLRFEEGGDDVLTECLERIRRKRLEKRKDEIRRRMRQFSPDDDEFRKAAEELTRLARELHG